MICAGVRMHVKNVSDDRDASGGPSLSHVLRVLVTPTRREVHVLKQQLTFHLRTSPGAPDVLRLIRTGHVAGRFIRSTTRVYVTLSKARKCFESSQCGCGDGFEP